MPKTRIGQKRTLFFLFGCVLIVFLFQWGKEMHRAGTYAQNPSYDAYDRVQWWIQSARCAQSQRKLLVVCDAAGTLHPIEDVSLADDRGEALAAGLVGLLSSHPLDETSLTKINICLNAVAILCLTILLGFVYKPWTAFLAMGCGTFYAIPGPIPGPDIPAAFIGLFVFGLLPVIWFASYPVQAPRLHQGIGNVIAFGGLLVANLFRQPFGLMAIVCSGLFIVERILRDPLPKKKTWALFLILTLSTIFTTSAILHIRNELYQLKPSSHVHSHGLSHALYLGLGAEPNPWGIEWNDTVGFRDAGIKEGKKDLYTPEYFAILRRRYIHLVLHYPLTVSHIYGVKLGKSLALFRWWGFKLYWGLLLLALGWGFAIRYNGRVAEPSFRTSLAFVCMFLALVGQGMLIIPWGMFLYPMKFCLVMAVACFSDGIAAFIHLPSE